MRAAHFTYKTHSGGIRLEDTETGLDIHKDGLLDPAPEIISAIGFDEPLPPDVVDDPIWRGWYERFTAALELWVGPKGFIHDPEAKITCRAGRAS